MLKFSWTFSDLKFETNQEKSGCSNWIGKIPATKFRITNRAIMELIRPLSF